MNQKYLTKLLQDMTLKNFTQSTMDGYSAYIRIFLEFINKDAMQVTYADIRKFIFFLKDEQGKMPSTINCYTAALKFFFEYTLGYHWDSKKVPKMKKDRKLPVILTRGILTSDSILQTVSKQAVKIGIKAHVTSYTMRHCLAVHLLEDGVSHTFIQQLLGHRSPASTDMYLQMTSKALMGIRSPFDTFGEANE